MRSIAIGAIAAALLLANTPLASSAPANAFAICKAAAELNP